MWGGPRRQTNGSASRPSKRPKHGRRLLAERSRRKQKSSGGKRQILVAETDTENADSIVRKSPLLGSVRIPPLLLYLGWEGGADRPAVAARWPRPRSFAVPPPLRKKEVAERRSQLKRHRHQTPPTNDATQSSSIKEVLVGDAPAPMASTFAPTSKEANDN